VVLAELEVVIDVGVPGLQVDCEGATSFATALVYIAGSVIEDLKHRD
jgi:hypothetical protein